MYLKLGRLYLGLEKKKQGIRALKRVRLLTSGHYAYQLICAFVKQYFTLLYEITIVPGTQ